MVGTGVSTAVSPASDVSPGCSASVMGSVSPGWRPQRILSSSRPTPCAPGVPGWRAARRRGAPPGCGAPVAGLLVPGLHGQGRPAQVRRTPGGRGGEATRAREPRAPCRGARAAVACPQALAPVAAGSSMAGQRAAASKTEARPAVGCPGKVLTLPAASMAPGRTAPGALPDRGGIGHRTRSCGWLPRERGRLRRA